MLELRDLIVGYDEFDATHGINIELKKGDFFALIGANGAGKSSTLMSIAGHTTVKSGQIMFNGEDITQMPPYERIKLGIAISPEGRRLFSDLTVSENLIVGGYTRSKKEAAESKAIVFSYFPRLHERIDQLAGSLSGGEQQMLALGRAMMTKPKLLMVDEVSLGLMPKAVDTCYDAMKRLNESGITILFVEQNTSRALSSANRVCALESGNVAWEGSAEEMKKTAGLVDMLMGMKADGDAVTK